MGRKSKHTAEAKICAVKEYLEGTIVSVKYERVETLREIFDKLRLEF